MLSRKIAGISIIRNKWAILSLLDSVRDSTSDVPFSSLSISSTSSEKIPENVIRAPESAKPASELLSSNKSKRKFDWSLTHWRVSEETNFRDSEQIILRDMIFALQGIDGKYIKYSEEYSKYLVSDSVSIPPPTIKFIEKICEGGALYRRVKSCLSLSTSQGRVRQSFSEVVRKLLADYFRLLAVLESQIIQTSLSSSSSSSKTKKNNDDKENNALTLRRLHVWLIDPLERLRVLADLCESTRAAEGGALASATFLHVQHGDETHTHRYKWVTGGVLDDPYQEFFVRVNESANEWNRRYHLVEQMIPRFVSVPLAKMILLLGKSIHFVRNCCLHHGSLSWKDVRKAHVTIDRECFKYEEQQQWGNGRLYKSIELATKNISKQLVDLLFREHKLMDHLRALKRYLLMGRGDFALCLMDAMQPELKSRASKFDIVRYYFLFLRLFLSFSSVISFLHTHTHTHTPHRYNLSSSSHLETRTCHSIILCSV